MLNTKRPLEEKMALFWHHVLATGHTKVEHNTSSTNQIEMFRCVGLADLRTALLDAHQMAPPLRSPTLQTV